MATISDIRRAVRLTLLTASLADEQPGSLLITAEVEEGKTTHVSQYAGQEGIAYLSDMTAYGIVEAYGQDMIEGRVHHIVIPELIRPLERSKETAASLIAFLSELVEEGVWEIQTFAKAIKLGRPMKAGVIACMAKGALLPRVSRWNSSGFLSRFLVLSYTYDQQTADSVMQAIKGQLPPPAPPLQLPPKTLIAVPGPLLDEIANLARQLAPGLYPPLHGFRLFKHLRRLAKASALEDGRAAVDQSDIDYLRTLSELMNLKFRSI